MQAQKMVIDFTNKTNQDSKITYKVGDYDKNGIDATLKGIDTAGLTAHLRVIDAEGTTQFTGAVSVAGDVANFRLPTTGPGTWFFELVAKNSNGEESSARYKYRLLETIGYDASVTIEYETLYTQISASYVKWQQDHERFEQTNVTLLATNVTANQKIIEMEQKKNDVNAAIAAGTVDLETKEARKDSAGFEHASLKVRLDFNEKRLNEDWYGVEFVGSNAVGKRLGRAQGLVANVGVDATVNVNDFDNQFPWSNIVTVNLGHDGVIKAYEGQPSFKRDGSNGEVMVRIPKFYQKRIESDSEYKAFFISKHKMQGYYLNPLFISDSTGEELDHAYIGAYKASSDGTKLLSRSGVYPQVSLSRTAFRTRAKATGAGFQLQDYLVRDLINSLLYIEFANLNLQTKMMGQVNFSAQKASIATTDANYAIVSNASANQYVEGQTVLVASQQRKLLSKTSHDASNTRLNFDGAPLTVAFNSTIDMRAWQCGTCDNVKQRSGSFISNADGKHPFVYRGIENLWGDMWEWVDGININEYQSYVSTNPSSYADNVYSGAYSAINGLNLATTSQYIKKMRFDERFPFFLLPEIGGGSSSTYYSDYYWCDPGERAPLVGGYWSNGVLCGPACWFCSNSAASSNVNFGARLSYKPL